MSSYTVLGFCFAVSILFLPASGTSDFHRARRSAEKRLFFCLPGLDYPYRWAPESSSDSESDHHSSTWHFGYRNINEWGQHYSECNGKKQSPVDLEAKLLTRLKVRSPFRWSGYRNTPRNMTIINNGHTVQMSATWNNKDAPYLSGGTLVGDYEFLQLHFHWSSTDGTGSEHTINNISHPLEMHMVHYKKEYGSPSEALKHEDGLAVVGILMKVGNAKNHGVGLLQRNIRAIQSPDAQISITPFPLAKFHLKFRGEYVSYSGSLTTPPCSEIVTWIIPANPRVVSHNQLNGFRSVNLAGRDDHNYRPTMPLNGRMLYFIGY